jgi:hypothetical protein
MTLVVDTLYAVLIKRLEDGTHRTAKETSELRIQTIVYNASIKAAPSGYTTRKISSASRRLKRPPRTRVGYDNNGVAGWYYKKSPLRYDTTAEPGPDVKLAKVLSEESLDALMWSMRLDSEQAFSYDLDIDLKDDKLAFCNFTFDLGTYYSPYDAEEEDHLFWRNLSPPIHV